MAGESGGFVTSTRGGAPARDQVCTVRKAAAVRVRCGARRRTDGMPCEALSVPGKHRCLWHGGCSTGPRTAEGKARSADNLRIFRLHRAAAQAA